VALGEEERARADDLRALGFGAFDALHIARAEAARADVLLTTVDAMVRRARRLRSQLSIRVDNPFTWLDEVTGT
jgi:hypothetical protein